MAYARRKGQPADRGLLRDHLPSEKGTRSGPFPVSLVIMSEQERQESKQGELKFRQGACYGAQWLEGQAARMAADGASPDQIAARLRERVQVLRDWREGRSEMPEGNPWEWPEDALLEFIARLKAEW